MTIPRFALLGAIMLALALPTDGFAQGRGNGKAKAKGKNKALTERIIVRGQDGEERERVIIIDRDPRDRDRDRRDRRDNDDDDIWDIILGDDDRDRRDRRLARNQDRGPAFCRSGAGHPVHGREWCREKGWGLGDRRDDGVIVIRRDTRDRDGGFWERALDRVLFWTD